MVGSRFEVGLAIGLGITEEGIADNGNQQQYIPDPSFRGI